MVYVPDPTDASRPTPADPAGSMCFEFQALKGYLQQQLAASSNFGAVTGFRNKLNNGSFNIAQRGTSVTIAAGASGYTLDQWIAVPTGMAATLLQTTGLSAPFVNSNVLAIQQAAGGTGMILSQRIESYQIPELLSGTTVTVSGWYKTDSLLNPVPQVLLQAPPARDIWTGGVTTTGAPQNLGLTVPQTVQSVWTYFKNTFVLSGDATLGMVLDIQWANGVASGPVYLANLQLEIGANASTFEVRPPSVDYDICQRYYKICQTFLAGYGVAGQIVGSVTTTGDPMRVTAGNATLLTNASSNVGSFSYTGATPAGCFIVQGTVTATGGFIINIITGISAEM